MYSLAPMYQASCWSSCSGPSWKSARARAHYRPCLEGLFGMSVLGSAGKTISPSLLFLSQTSVGKRSRRLHRVSPCREQFLGLTGGCCFVAIYAAWGAGVIGLTSKLRLPWRTPQAMRAILLASAIANLNRLSRRAAASIQDLRPCFSHWDRPYRYQLFFAPVCVDVAQYPMNP